MQSTLNLCLEDKDSCIRNPFIRFITWHALNLNPVVKEKK